MPRPWKPSPTLQASMGLHGLAAAGLLVNPEHWPFWLGTLAANHALLTGAGLLPRTSLLGPNLTRLPDAACQRQEIALTFDDGPDPVVTPRVLDMLDRPNPADREVKIRATFFCIGHKAEQYPELCREIVRRGHQVENHGHSHAKAFATFGPRRMMRDILAAQDCLTAITGRRPRFFRATAGLRNPFLEPVLARLDLQLAAWTRRPYDTRCGDADTVLHRLTRQLGPGDILLLHDGNSALTQSGQPVILAVLPQLLDRLAAQHLHPVSLDTACP